MNSNSDNSPMKNRKRNTRSLVVSSSSDDDDDDLDFPRRQKRTRARVSSSSDDSDESVIVARSHKKLRALSESDSSGSSSASARSIENDIIRYYASEYQKSKQMALRTDSESSDGGDNTKQKSNGEAEFQTGSQSSDEESEKCIICFKAFRGVIAHPSGCTHNFHSECLLQWSKTSNTCPIDRVKYTQIIVTGSEGNVVTRHEVSTPTPDADLNDIEPDDPTFCEVCSQHDRENEMLLCDQCEAGYHMDCLTPPLSEVPLGDWFCPDCSANDNAAEIDHDELNDLLTDSTTVGNRLRSRRSPLASRRIGPRTRAAQRILSTIRRRMAEEIERYQPSSSMSSRVTTRRRKKSHRRRRAHYEVNLVTVEGTTIEVKVAVNAVRRQKKKRNSNASTSGLRRACSSKRNSSSAGLAIDDQLLSGNHTNLRQPLDIFGSRPQLEYFSGWEAEDELDEEGGVAVLRPRNVGVRGMANRKQMAAQILRSVPRRPTPRINVSSAPPDLLSSILDEQAKWHSPNAVIQSNSNGEVKVIVPNKETNLPVRKSVGSGEASTSSEGKSSSSSSSSTSHKESGGGGQRNGEASSSVPPLQPPPQPNFSRVYEDEDFDLYADIEPPYVKPMKSYNKKQ